MLANDERAETEAQPSEANTAHWEHLSPETGSRTHQAVVAGCEEVVPRGVEVQRPHAVRVRDEPVRALQRLRRVKELDRAVLRVQTGRRSNTQPSREQSGLAAWIE